MENFTAIGYQLPIIITFWITIIFAVLFTLGMIGFSRGYEPVGYTASTGAFGAMALILLVIMLVPFDKTYHQIYRVTGEVTSVSNVISDSGGDLTRTPVLTVEGIDRDITMSDPRAVNLQGKTVDLTCSVGWTYQGADIYSCKIHKVH